MIAGRKEGKKEREGRVGLSLGSWFSRTCSLVLDFLAWSSYHLWFWGGSNILSDKHPFDISPSESIIALFNQQPWPIRPRCVISGPVCSRGTYIPNINESEVHPAAKSPAAKARMPELYHQHHMDIPDYFHSSALFLLWNVLDIQSLANLHLWAILLRSLCLLYS